MTEPTRAPDIGPSSSSSKYRSYRRVFIGGFALSILLWFVPSVTMKVGGFLGVGGEEKTLSVLDVVRMLFRAGHLGFAFFLVLLFCISAAFLVLAIKYPRRWVFVAGSSYAVFGIILDVFSGSGTDVHYIYLPKAMGYLATAMTLVGFWCKPPAIVSRSELATSGGAES